MKRKLSRRRFTQIGTAACGSLALGCGEDQRDPDSPSPGPAGSGGERMAGASGGQGTGGQGLGGDGEGALGGQAALGGLGGMPRTCGDLTAANIEGPFYLAGSPQRTDIRGAEPGPRAIISGVVYDTNCRPIPGALIDFWQANEAGAYDVDGNTFRGHQVTSEGGAYTLSTIVPGRYLNGSRYRPAHLHAKVIVPGYRLTTQLYFPEDPFNEGDAFFLQELVVRVVESRSDELIAAFDFYLPAIS